jgi:hypothetical protein
VYLENADEMTVKVWASLLSDLVSVPDEISESNIDRLILLLRKMLATIVEQDLGTSSADNLISSLGAVLQIIVFHEMENNVQDLVALYSRLVASELAIGETVSPIVLSFLRVQAASLRADSAEIELFAPSSGLESYAGTTRPALRLQDGGNKAESLSIGWYSMSVEAIQDKNAIGDSVGAYISEGLSNETVFILTLPIRRFDFVDNARHYQTNETFRGCR